MWKQFVLGSRKKRILSCQSMFLILLRFCLSPSHQQFSENCDTWTLTIFSAQRSWEGQTETSWADEQRNRLYLYGSFNRLQIWWVGQYIRSLGGRGEVFLGVGLSVKTAINHWRQERVRGRWPPKETVLETWGQGRGWRRGEGAEKNRWPKMHPIHKTFRANISPLENNLSLVCQEEGLKVGGRVSYCCLAWPGARLGCVRPQVLCCEINLNSWGLSGVAEFPDRASENWGIESEWWGRQDKQRLTARGESLGPGEVHGQGRI